MCRGSAIGEVGHLHAKPAVRIKPARLLLLLLFNLDNRQKKREKEKGEGSGEDGAESGDELKEQL